VKIVQEVKKSRSIFMWKSLHVQLLILRPKF
jgi:hypothetical protein